MVRTHPGYGARRSVREDRSVSLPRGRADMAQTTTVLAVGGHPTVYEQQRRHGNVATAESWIRACVVGVTRRGMTRLVMGTKTKTSGGCAARVADVRAAAGERSSDRGRSSREGAPFGRASELGSSPFASRRPSPASAFGLTARGGLRLPARALTRHPVCAASDQRWSEGRVHRGPAPVLVRARVRVA